MKRKNSYTTDDHKKAFFAYRKHNKVFLQVRKANKDLPTVAILILWAGDTFRCTCPWHNYKRLDNLLQKTQKDIENYISLTSAGRKKIFEQITGAVTILDDIDPIELAVLGNLDHQIELDHIIEPAEKKLKKKQKKLDKTYFMQLVVDDTQKLADWHAIRTYVLSHIFNVKFPEMEKYLVTKENKWSTNLNFNNLEGAIKALAEIDKQISLLTGEHPTEITDVRGEIFDYDASKTYLEAVRAAGEQINQEELTKKIVTMIQHKKNKEEKE